MAVKMHGIIAICTFATLLLAVHSNGQHHDHHHHGSKSAEPHLGDEACHILFPANADFGFALYKRLSAKSAAGNNIFFSPLGISAGLSMLTNGAREETHRQLFSTLGYSAFNQTQVDEAYEHLFHMLQEHKSNQELLLGNAAAVHQSFNPLKSYMDEVKEHYSAEVLNVNFNEPDDAAAQINGYIARKTGDMIKDMVKDLDPNTAMMLINSIYFTGEWEKPFDGNQTEKMDFNVDESTKVKVDMMKRTGRYDFYQDAENHVSVIMLPYKGNTSMMIMLPNEGKMKHVEDLITKEHVIRWKESFFRTSVDLFLPKFSIGADASLEDMLKEMGVTDAFSDNANFSGISAETRLKVSKVSHRAVLNVDEVGTKAAAATTLEIMPMMMPEVMKIDRPFLVLILEHSTRSMLFMGKISNPTSM